MVHNVNRKPAKSVLITYL